VFSLQGEADAELKVLFGPTYLTPHMYDQFYSNYITFQQIAPKRTLE
jgi:hypothetical protein